MPVTEVFQAAADSDRQPVGYKLSRELVNLAEQSAQFGLQALPGKEWSLHYSQGSKNPIQVLQELLDGTIDVDVASRQLKPDAVIFDIHDLETLGFEAVSAKVHELTAFYGLQDYRNYAEFVASMRDKNISLEDIQKVYTGISRARVQKRLYDAYGGSGKRSLESALTLEMSDAENRFARLSSINRVLAALKQNWLSGEIKLSTSRQGSILEGLLTADERQLYEKLRDDYYEYLQNGDVNAYKRLTQTVGDQFADLIKPTLDQNAETSDAGQQLEKELENLDKQPGPIGSKDDPAIPHADQDEYRPEAPPDSSGNQETAKGVKIYFEIRPPLGGYYVRGRKSYYSISEKEWSKKKSLKSYSDSVKGTERHNISGYLGTEITALPIPRGYAVDTASLQTNINTRVEFFRDQNGCFYFQAETSCKYGVDFVKSDNYAVENLINSDIEQMYQGSLTTETEKFLAAIDGDNIRKVKLIKSYINAHHFYPGGGDLKMAQGVQYKLRQESTGENYIYNLDQSEYLECYSANTLFCAMMRKKGVPARLVVGDKVEGSQNGRSLITDQTGHAWSEIWDGNKWIRFDATPPPKPEDKKQNKNPQEEKDSAPEAKDENADKDESSNQSNQKDESDSSQEQISEASDEQKNQSEKMMENAKQKNKEMQQAVDQIKEKIKDAKTVEEIEKLKEELEKLDMPEDIDGSIEDAIEAKSEIIKDELKEKIQEMAEDGFLDQDKADQLKDKIDENSMEAIKQVEKEIQREKALFDEYEAYRQAVQPYVDSWWKYFAEQLPKEKDVDQDEDSLSRSGKFNRASIKRMRNLIFGQIKNPRKFLESIRPKFMASIVVDVSGSMGGDKLKQAILLMVFYNELFGRISKEYGYIRYANYVFADAVTEVKSFDHDYFSTERYRYEDGTQSTVKVHIMNALRAGGGTNMMEAAMKVGQRLNDEQQNYNGFCSAMYFVGDGDDTCGNSQRVKQYLNNVDAERGGFGQHIVSAIMLGGESQRQALAKIFGDENTTVAANLEELIGQSMAKFDDDMRSYLDGVTRRG